MKNALHIEAQRLVIQRRLDGSRPQPQRNQLGQFATPAPLAEEILRYARTRVGKGAVRFLDPAIGTGAFYSALLRTWPRSRIARATGFEVDPYYGSPCRALWSTSPLQLRLEDFTAALPPRRLQERYSLIVCNPPYVRHHHLSPATKQRLQQRSMSASGIHLSGRAGLHAHFLTLMDPWMAPGALAGWLIPSEFMDVNYGDAIKTYLLSRTLLRIHRFQPSDVQFDDALVSSAIVWLRNARPSARHQVELTSGGSLSRPERKRRVPASSLSGARKWSAFFYDPPRAESGATLGDYFHIKRGVATGANKFFIMSAEQAQMRGIPATYLRSVLPGPRDLEQDEIKADEQGRPILQRPLVMLDCPLSCEQIRERHPELWRYLQTDGMQIAQRYLCSRRSPWYSQERRESTFFLCSYVARQNRDGRVQRFIFNQSAAIAANNYLMLYPRESVARFVNGEAARARLVWSELCRIKPEALRGAGRVYGGGMYKLEPGELASVAAPGVAALLS